MTFFGSRHSTIILIALIVLLHVLANRSAAVEDEADDAAHAPEWNLAPTGHGQLLSINADDGADSPIVAYAPDGNELMVTYNRRFGGPNDRDLFYRLYDDQSWTSPAPIQSTPGTASGQAALTYNANNVAHVSWEEPGQGLVYTNYDGNWGLPPETISGTSLPILGTAIATSGSQIVDVVWGQSSPPSSSPDIYHARSNDGGENWSAPAPIAQTAPTSGFPQIVTDGAGLIHVVWQESTAAPGFQVRYARGPQWTMPVTISPGSMEEAKRPSITHAGGRLHVAFTKWEDDSATNVDQWAYYTSCQSNCTQASSWSNAQNASGQPVRVNESAPFDLITDIVVHNGCTYIFFHGYVQAVSNNEVIWDVNSCDAWSSGRDQVTGFDMRGIYPRVAVHDNLIKVVYEWVESPDHQVYLIEGEFPPPGLYLPVMFRQ